MKQNSSLNLTVYSTETLAFEHFFHRVATFQTTWNSLTFPIAWTGKDYRYTAQSMNSRCFTLIITSIVTNLLKATRVSMMNISKVQAHKLQLQLFSSFKVHDNRWKQINVFTQTVHCIIKVRHLKQIWVSLTFPWPLWNSLTFPSFPGFPGEWPPCFQ